MGRTPVWCGPLTRRIIYLSPVLPNQSRRARGLFRTVPEACIDLILCHAYFVWSVQLQWARAYNKVLVYCTLSRVSKLVYFASWAAQCSTTSRAKNLATDETGASCGACKRRLHYRLPPGSFVSRLLDYWTIADAYRGPVCRSRGSHDGKSAVTKAAPASYAD